MSKIKHSFRFSFLALALLALPITGRAQSDPQNSALAAQIDNYLNGVHPTNNQRPLAGHGTNFTSEGATYNVDPRFIVAISGAETTFGAFTCSEDNAFNWFWNPGTGCHQSPFDSWDAGIHTVSHYMQKSYLLKGYTSIPVIGARYCASGCEHWVPNVTSVYQNLGGDPNGALTFPTNVSATGTVETPQQEPEATPVITATLTANPSTTTSTSKSLSYIAEATFSNLTTQHVSGVELYRDTTPKPVHIASLLRVTGSPDTEPVFRGNFTLPANDPGTGLRVRGQLSKNGKSLGTLTSDPLALSPASKPFPWLIVGIIVGVLVLVMGVIVIILLLRKRKSGPAPVKAAAETKPAATVTEIRPATTEDKSADAKTGTTTK